MSELVSVIVPVYNVAKYLEQSLESLVTQTYENLEIILINDGSVDGSDQICDKYASCDARIRVIHQKNQGAAMAKNSGLDVFTGAYFTFVDSDDYVERNMIENMVINLEKYRADIVEFNFWNEYLSGTVEMNVIEKVSEETQINYLKRYTSQWTCGLLWNKLYKRELTEDIRFRNERRCVDDEFYTYKLVGNSKKIVRIPEAYYHYRIRKSSAVNSDKNKYQKNSDFLEYVEERYQYILKEYPMLKETFLEHLINGYLIQSQKEWLKETDYLRIQIGLKRIIKENRFNKICIKYRRSMLLVIRKDYFFRRVVLEERSGSNNLFD